MIDWNIYKSLVFIAIITFSLAHRLGQFHQGEMLHSRWKWIIVRVLISWSMSKQGYLWRPSDVVTLWYFWHHLRALEPTCWLRGEKNCLHRIKQQKAFNIFGSHRIHDISRSGFNDWPFMTVHQWEESPQGVWELEIHNKGRYMGKQFVYWKPFFMLVERLILCGTFVCLWRLRP